jgi:hypothetical protein
MQEPVPILPAQQLATVSLSSEFTIRFAVLGTSTNSGNIIEIAAADGSLGLLSVTSTVTNLLWIQYYDSAVSVLADLLRPDWQTEWTTIEITVSADRMTWSSSFNSTPTVFTGFGLFNTSGKHYLVRASDGSLDSAGGFIRDVEISGKFAFLLGEYLRVYLCLTVSSFVRLRLRRRACGRGWLYNLLQPGGPRRHASCGITPLPVRAQTT